MTRSVTKPKNSQRLVGIDLLRGISAYAVILIHVGTLMTFLGLPTNQFTTAITEISRFAVPFFLASSFYLMTKKLYTNDHKFSLLSTFISRSERLLIPYFSWSLIYLSLKVVKTLAESKSIDQLFQDPVLLVFIGGASIHLYFLPLLFIGSFLIILAEFFARQGIPLKTLIIGFIISVVVYEVQILSGNEFEFYTKFGSDCLAVVNSCSIAFKELTMLIFPTGNNSQIVRLCFVVIAWLIKCLPYILLAMIMNHPKMKMRISALQTSHALVFLVCALLLAGFWLMNINQILYFPQSVYELGMAFSLLISGLAMSDKLPNSKLIANLGISSFGIYLIHYLVLTIYISFIAKFLNQFFTALPVITMLLIGIIGFLSSWLIVFIGMRIKPISKVLFSA